MPVACRLAGLSARGAHYVGIVLATQSGVGDDRAVDMAVFNERCGVARIGHGDRTGAISAIEIW
jgi:hypothetical protein